STSAAAAAGRGGVRAARAGPRAWRARTVSHARARRPSCTERDRLRARLEARDAVQSLAATEEALEVSDDRPQLGGLDQHLGHHRAERQLATDLLIEHGRELVVVGFAVAEIDVGQQRDPKPA